MKNLILIFAISLLGCKSSQSLIEHNNNIPLFASHIFPVKYDQLWGYADFYGNTIINPQFDEASLFQYGMAIVKQNNEYGYINDAGNWMIQPKYKNAEPFNLRYHGIKNEDGTGQKGLIAKVNNGAGDYYINSAGKSISVTLSNEIGGCVQILPKLAEYSIENEDGSYELTYQYWKYWINKTDTLGQKIMDTTNLKLDTTNLKLDTIIELNRHFALLKKDSNYTIYNTEISKGVDIVENKRILIPDDSTYTVIPDFIYQDVKLENTNGVVKPTSIYKKDGYWGVPGYTRKPIIPFVYPDIIKRDINGTYLVEFEKEMFGYISVVRDSHHYSNSIVVEHFKRKRR